MILRTLLLVPLFFLAGCASLPVDQYEVETALLPDTLRTSLQDEYPRHLVDSATMNVSRGRAPSYRIRLITADGRTRDHEVSLDRRDRPRVEFKDRNRDGAIDFETRRYSGTTRRSWQLFDDNFDGVYERRLWLGSFPWNVPVHIPVSTPGRGGIPKSDNKALRNRRGRRF